MWRHFMDFFWKRPQERIESIRRLEEKQNEVIELLRDKGLLEGYEELDHSYKKMVDRAEREKRRNH